MRDFGSLLRFDESYKKRIWGGRKLREVLGKPTPSDAAIGEAWLVSDHPQHVSTVIEGRSAGATLRALLEEQPENLLGTTPRLTPQGRFPLLLKLIDSDELLSIQVHPDDAACLRLGEADVGKTEMWHVLEADPGAELLCGVNSGVSAQAFSEAIQNGTVESLMQHYPASEGMSVYLKAGTAHAIGRGLLIAEIQQNSDITYRLYDYGRLENGQPRVLHVEKALQVLELDSAAGPAPEPLWLEEAEARVGVLAACVHFAAEELHVNGRYRRITGGRSFHILLNKRGMIWVSAGNERMRLERGNCVLVPGSEPAYEIEGNGQLLAYYVPDIPIDIAGRLSSAGHSAASIATILG